MDVIQQIKYFTADCARVEVKYYISLDLGEKQSFQGLVMLTLA